MVEEIRSEIARMDALIVAARRDCRCGRKDGGHLFTGGQHHNGPCAGDQERVEWAGRHRRCIDVKRELEELLASGVTP
jgi:hypothetical protein